MSIFEIISKEQFDEASTETVFPVGGEGAGVSMAAGSDTLPLQYCKFCKGFYNEYHFGDVEEGGETNSYSNS